MLTRAPGFVLYWFCWPPRADDGFGTAASACPGSSARILNDLRRPLDLDPRRIAASENLRIKNAKREYAMHAPFGSRDISMRKIEMTLHKHELWTITDARALLRWATPTLVGLALLVGSPLASGDDVGTAFTYQGELLDNGSPAGSPTPVDCDFEFTLWDAAVAGTQIGPTLTPTVTVTDGRFTEQLDFGDDQFEGSPRYLQIQVCCPSTCAPGYTPLDPRQELTPAPYALALPALRNTPSGAVAFPDSPNVIGGHHDNNVGASVAGGTISGGGIPGSGNSVTANFGVVGGGHSNTASGSISTVSGGAGNDATALRSTIGGGDTNTAGGTAATVAGGQNNTAAGNYGTVGGGISNIVSADYATISGGGESSPGTSSTGNRVFDEYGTVGGGGNNKVGSDDGSPTSARRATVSGGLSNTASGESSTVGGGYINEASGLNSTIGGGYGSDATASAATVGGGQLNHATAFRATVGGGGNNNATGDSSTVGGGANNHATGEQATVGGGAVNIVDGAAATVAGGSLNKAAGDYDTVGGGRSNEVSADYGTISGGGRSDPGDPATGNRVFDDYGTVGGGGRNKAGTDDADPTWGRYATVGGGEWNEATLRHTTVGGGWGNKATSAEATVGGGSVNIASGQGSTVGGGLNNNATGFDSAVGGGEGNAATGHAATVGGGSANSANGLFVTIAGGFLNTTFGDHASIGGGQENDVSGAHSTIGGGRGNDVQASYGTIAGGGESNPGLSATRNRVLDDYGTVGGGGNNRAGSDDADPLTATFATVSGGYNNTAAGQFSAVAGGQQNDATATHSTVGGGNLCVASGVAATVSGGDANQAIGAESTVSGGFINRAYGLHSVVSGGGSNVARGDSSTVPGGSSNTAGGDYSFAGGRDAEVRDAAASGDADGDEGTFVWCDSNGDTSNRCTSTGPDQFLIAASGGVGIGTTAPSNSQLHVETGDTFKAIYGRNTNTSFGYTGVSGRSDSIVGIGVDGFAAATSGTAKAVQGYTNSPNGYGAYFTGADGSRNYFQHRVGIGTDSPSAPLDIEGAAGTTDIHLNNTAPNGDPTIRFQLGGTTAFSLGVDNSDADKFKIGTGAPQTNTRLTIDASGNVGIGRSPTTYKLEVQGSAGKTSGGSSWAVISDARIKTNVQTVRDALATVNSIRLVAFDYTDEYRSLHPESEDRRHYSVIAQEYAEVFPDHVKPMKGLLPDGGDALSVDLHPLTIHSVAAIQELHQTVKQQQRTIDDLRRRTREKDREIGALEAQLQVQQQLMKNLQWRLARIEALMVGMNADARGVVR